MNVHYITEPTNQSQVVSRYHYVMQQYTMEIEYLKFRLKFSFWEGFALGVFAVAAIAWL